MSQKELKEIVSHILDIISNMKCKRNPSHKSPIVAVCLNKICEKNFLCGDCAVTEPDHTLKHENDIFTISTFLKNLFIENARFFTLPVDRVREYLIFLSNFEKHVEFEGEQKLEELENQCNSLLINITEGVNKVLIKVRKEYMKIIDENKKRIAIQVQNYMDQFRTFNRDTLTSLMTDFCTLAQSGNFQELHKLFMQKQAQINSRRFDLLLAEKMEALINKIHKKEIVIGSFVPELTREINKMENRLEVFLKDLSAVFVKIEVPEYQLDYLLKEKGEKAKQISKKTKLDWENNGQIQFTGFDGSKKPICSVTLDVKTFKKVIKLVDPKVFSKKSGSFTRDNDPFSIRMKIAQEIFKYVDDDSIRGIMTLTYEKSLNGELL